MRWSFLLLCGLILMQTINCSQGECRFDADCQGIQLCDKGQCGNPLTQTPQCKTPQDCQNTETCLQGQCTARECEEGKQQSCYEGNERTKGIGECKSGIQVCLKGLWGACEGQIQDQAEICDEKDNDCDGKTDENGNCQAPETCQTGETRPCFPGDTKAAGVGACKQGRENCEKGAWNGLCLGAVLPKEQEVCGNNEDDDCDGQTDEACGDCKEGDVEVCYSGITGCTQQKDGSFSCNEPCKVGNRTCRQGKWSTCEGEKTPNAKEICDNQIDDNCNGEINEGCPTQTRLHQKCEDTEDCDPGQLCVNIGTSAAPRSLCWQECTPNPSVCQQNTDGRTECIPIVRSAEGKVLSACVQTRKRNQQCDYSVSIVCVDQLQCVRGVCSP